MTDRELMQQALDALIDAADSQSWEMQQNIDQHGDWYRRSVYLKQATAKSQETIEALRARLAQPEQLPAGDPATQQEPVAWVECDGEFVWNNREAAIGRNLYTAPPQQPEQEPLWIRNDEGKLELHAPPQREWQGLTDEEIKAAWSQLWYDLNNGKFAASDDPSRHTTVMFARAIEAKLKAKNA